MLLFAQRQTLRAPVNQLDKSTVISIYPKRIDEYKVTLQPGRFIIESGTYDKPSILVVGPSSWWKDTDPDQPLLEQPVWSTQIAESIVKDYCNGLVGCDMDGSMPGLFWIPGSYTLDQINDKSGEIKTNEGTKIPIRNMLNKYKETQKNWFNSLVKVADVDWSRTNGNPLSVSDLSRMAARELGLNKEWLGAFQQVELVKCIACGNLRNSAYPICSTCKAIVDPVRAKELNLTFAQ